MLTLGNELAHDEPPPYPATPMGRCEPPHSPITRLFAECPAPKLVYRGDTIATQGAAATSVYQILSGTVRCCLVTEDGHRQILRFARKGDIIGATADKEWTFTAEAVDDVVIQACPRFTLDAALRHDPAMRPALHSLICRELAHRERLLVMVSRMHADDRLLAFLQGFAQQPPETGGWTHLPMGRQDLADHLGLSFETVSRAFSALKRRCDIAMDRTDRYRLLDGTRRAAA